MEQLYDLVMNCRDRYNGLTEKEVWDKIGTYHLGAGHMVCYAGTKELAPQFIPF